MTSPTAFVFKALRRDGTVETGIVEATTRDAAAALIGSRGAFAIEVSAESPRAAGRLRVNTDDLALGLRTLATLLGSGLPIARALTVMDDIVPPAWLAALPDLRARVERGEPLGHALQASTLPLAPHVIGVIQAGEAGSGLGRAVETAAHLLERRAAAHAALRNALAYPVIVALAGTASVTLLIAIVLPRFAGLLTDMGQALPIMTRLVLGFGDLAHATFLPSLLIMAAGVAVWRSWVAHPDARIRWDQWLLGTPVVGPIRWSSAASNGCAALAALLQAGLPFAAALPHAARATGDHAVEARLLAARRRIVAGEGIAAALRAESALTPTVVRLVRLGEETGRLAEMLAHAASIESGQALQELQRAIRLVEPALILLFGGVVMVVAAGLLQAMYGLRP